MHHKQLYTHKLDNIDKMDKFLEKRYKALFPNPVNNHGGRGVGRLKKA